MSSQNHYCTKCGKVTKHTLIKSGPNRERLTCTTCQSSQEYVTG